MSEIAEAGEIIETKSEFARRTNVTPGRVTQWIDAGKISKDALDGEGRSARIRVRLALEQLNRTLDIDQRVGNGLLTRLDIPPAAVASTGADGSDPSASAADTVADKIQRERLEELQRRNRAARRDEAVEAGLLTSASDAQRQFGKLAASLVTVFEGALSEFATALSARFKVPHRDVLHLLRGEFRKARAAATESLRRQAAELPGTVQFDLSEDTESAPPEGGKTTDGQ